MLNTPAPRMGDLGAFPAETPSEGEILGLDGNTLGMDSSQVGVFEQGDEVSFSSLLKSHDSRGLETKVGLEILSDFTDETLEGELPNEQLG